MGTTWDDGEEWRDEKRREVGPAWWRRRRRRAVVEGEEYWGQWVKREEAIGIVWFLKHRFSNLYVVPSCAMLLLFWCSLSLSLSAEAEEVECYGTCNRCALFLFSEDIFFTFCKQKNKTKHEHGTLTFIGVYKLCWDRSSLT